MSMNASRLDDTMSAVLLAIVVTSAFGLDVVLFHEAGIDAAVAAQPAVAKAGASAPQTVARLPARRPG